MIGTDFPAIPGLHVGRPPAIGRVFFVHGITGNDGNNGLDPGTPWQTITYALTQCVNNRNDYIIVLDCWQQEPAWPIVVNKTRVHIIGVSNPTAQYSAMQPATDNPVFSIGAAGMYAEIAGFILGGDPASTNGCIDLQQAIGTWIHHCDFGSDLAGGAPQDGIRLSAGNAEGVLIENCRFFGSAGIVKGTLTNDGIFNPGGGGSRCLHMVIRNCIFMGLPNIAIELTLAEGVQILNNFIACRANVNGVGITLGIASEGCLISGNQANFGDSDMGNNPYEDLAAGGDNHWGTNYKGTIAVQPV